MILILLINLLLAQEPAICEYSAHDIGHITGIGENVYQAQANVAKVCFERRVELYKRLRGDIPSEERQLLFIDSCVNIECEDKEKK